jgi:LysR family transcriptional regulator, low CO2-responsive transcriptional regulator
LKRERLASWDFPEVELAMLGAPLINVSQLLTFYFVGKEGNITAAAEQLCITQPAVTKQIRALQNQFGVKLIHVKKRRVYLTEVGQELFLYAEEVYHAVAKAESFLQTDRNTNFRVGISSSLTAYLTPILDAFKESNPSMVLNVKEGASVQIVEELLDFQHDLVLVPPLYKISGELRIIHIPEAEKMVLVTSPVGPLAMKEHIAWKDLHGCPFILHREGSILRQLILDYFKERNIDIHVAANIDSIAFMKRLVEKGKGLALMLPASVKEETAAKRLKVLPVTDGDFWLGIDIVMQKQITSSPACRAFLRLLETHFNREIL